MGDSIYTYNKGKGLGEFLWSLCPVCGNASVRTTIREDGTGEQGECLVCIRMAEIMELEEMYLAAEKRTSEGPGGKK